MTYSKVIIKSTTELKPLFIKGNNSGYTSCSGFLFVADFNASGKIDWLGKYSEIPDINNSGNIVWHQVQKGIPEVGVLSQYSRMSDIIGYKGSLIQASRKTFMPI